MDNSHFLFSSDTPVDKIAFAKEGEATLDGDGLIDITIEHGLGTPLFTEGIWSDDDFATAWTFGTIKYTGDTISVRSSLVADSTNITAHIEKTPNLTIKYRIWGYISEKEVGTEAPKTSIAITDKFTLDTDNNLPKLVLEGYADPDTTLNYEDVANISCAAIWGDMSGNGEWSALADGIGQVYGGFGDFVTLQPGNSAIYFSNLTGCPTKYYYRFYTS